MSRTDERPRTRGGVVLLLLVSTQLMLGLDTSVVTVALPTIGADLGLGLVGQSWVQNAYVLAFGGLLLLGGRLGDVAGRRRTLVVGVTVFTAASALAAAAPTGAWLVTARALQGVGAALAAPSTLSLLTVTFPAGPERDRALSLYSAVLGAGASVGMVLGGLLTAGPSWPWVFLINLPIGAAVLVLAPRVLPGTATTTGRLDASGTALSALGMTALVFGLTRAATDGWTDATALGALAVAVVALGGFVAQQRRSRAPIVGPRVLADPLRRRAYTASVLLGAAMFGNFYLATQFLQRSLGFGAPAAGLAFVPLTASTFLVVRLVPRVLTRVGAHRPAAAGALVVAAGMAWLAAAPPAASYPAHVLGPLLVIGLGAGAIFMPITSTIMATVPPSDTGAASSLVQAAQWVGASLGVAVLVGVTGTVLRSGAALPSALGAGMLGAAVLALAGAVLAATLRPTSDTSGRPGSAAEMPLTGVRRSTIPARPHLGGAPPGPGPGRAGGGGAAGHNVEP